MTVFSIVSAQTVINDDCADALPISVGAECTFQDFTSVGATSEPTSVAPNPNCGGYQGGDVWFTFEVPASGNFRVEMTSVSNDPALAGETLYLRAFRFISSQGIDFDLCIWEIDPPVNDNCADALGLTVGETCTTESFSSLFSTSEPTSVAPNPNCGGYQGGDVWFAFEAPASGNFRIEMSSVGSNSQWALYSGSCGNFTQLKCASSNNQLSSNFSDPALAGETLYLRAFRFVSPQGIDFDLCIWEIDPPVNDNCADATGLTVGETCTTESFSSLFSTAEPTSVAPNPNCGGYQGGDVWFTFQAPASGNFRIEMSSTGNNSQWALYSGSCGDFTQLKCASSNNQLNSNFSDPSLAGETLYLRAFRFVSPQGIDFDLCIWEIDPPDNNQCDDAEWLSLSDECVYTAHSSVYATSSSADVVSNPSCGAYQGGDVWFAFEAPASGQFSVNRNNLSTGSASMAFYTGSCGEFTEIECSG
ncbi:MAG: hypothetical protein LC670_10755, partial [Flavobacteriales bacterium]|nr:hypothetical protein [Flavobacteriales bacterium]